MRMALACIVTIAAFVGFGEGIAWLMYGFAILVGAAAMVLIVGSMSSGVPVLHGHGDTRRRAANHERRHKKVYRGVGGKGGYTRVWKEGDGYAGEFYPGRGWKKLPSEAQAAVYAAGALGPSSEGKGCYASDLAAVDGLGVSRGTAAQIARKHL